MSTFVEEVRDALITGAPGEFEGDEIIGLVDLSAGATDKILRVTIGATTQDVNLGQSATAKGYELADAINAAFGKEVAEWSDADKLLLRSDFGEAITVDNPGAGASAYPIVWSSSQAAPQTQTPPSFSPDEIQVYHSGRQAEDGNYILLTPGPANPRRGDGLEDYLEETISVRSTTFGDQDGANTIQSNLARRSDIISILVRLGLTDRIASGEILQNPEPRQLESSRQWVWRGVFRFRGCT